jgi:hypothetical protein
MRMVVGGLQPARLTYIAVRAIDDFANISALPPPVQAVTRGMRFGGRVIDTVTWQGIPGATVSFGIQSKATGPDGEFEFTEQGLAEGTIVVRDELNPGVGNYFDYTKPYTAKHLDVVNLYLIPNYQLTTTFYADFLDFFRRMTDVQGIPYPPTSAAATFRYRSTSVRSRRTGSTTRRRYAKWPMNSTPFSACAFSRWRPVRSRRSGSRRLTTTLSSAISSKC